MTEAPLYTPYPNDSRTSVVMPNSTSSSTTKPRLISGSRVRSLPSGPRDYDDRTVAARALRNTKLWVGGSSPSTHCFTVFESTTWNESSARVHT